MFGRLAGYQGVNDAEKLCRDAAMRWVVGDRAIIAFAPSASLMGRFETKGLAGRRTLLRSPICRGRGSTRCSSSGLSRREH